MNHTVHSIGNQVCVTSYGPFRGPRGTILAVDQIVDDREDPFCFYLGTLPLKQRHIVWMRYADQLTFAEIGRQFHIPASTAKTSFWRARLTLRQELGEEVLGR